MTGLVLTRRDFVARASRLGIGLAILPADLASLVRPRLGDGPVPQERDHHAAAGPFSPELFSGLRWRMIGPFRGGRVAAATGVPGRPHDFYFGAVNGGVWKTIDVGRASVQGVDSQPVPPIGAINVAPSHPTLRLVGSGRSELRDPGAYGNGVCH